MTIRNPFRKAPQRAAFDEMVRNWQTRSRLLFLPGGERCMGNSWAGSFWRGYDAAPGTPYDWRHPRWDSASKQMLTYVYVRAGAACRLAAGDSPRRTRARSVNRRKGER